MQFVENKGKNLLNLIKLVCRLLGSQMNTAAVLYCVILGLLCGKTYAFFLFWYLILFLVFQSKQDNESPTDCMLGVYFIQ